MAKIGLAQDDEGKDLPHLKVMRQGGNVFLRIKRGRVTTMVRLAPKLANRVGRELVHAAGKAEFSDGG